MCHSCWRGYPIVDVTSAIRDAAAAVSTMYERHHTGGAMHVATDDWNIQDDTVQWCGEHGNFGEPLDDVERACFEALIRLSEDERATALAIHDGYYEPSDIPLSEVTADHLAAERTGISWTPTGNHVLSIDRDAVPYCSCGRRWPDDDGEDAYSLWERDCFAYERRAGPMREPEPLSKFDVMHNEMLAEQGLPPMWPKERF